MEEIFSISFLSFLEGYHIENVNLYLILVVGFVMLKRNLGDNDQYGKRC
jgi:hypothetical protein